MREEDLEGHMPPQDGKDTTSDEEKQKIEEDSQVKMLLEKDNQVRHALELLKTWTIFSQIKTGPLK